MHLKVMQQMTVIPRSVGVPPLSDANFEQVLMTNAMIIHQQQQQQQLLQQQLRRHSPTAGAGATMTGHLASGGNSDGLSITNSNNTLSSSSSSSSLPQPPPPQQQQQLVLQQQHQPLSFTSLLEDDGRMNNNPLAGMGLSDEQYNTILQNLVNGERFMGMVDGTVGASGGSGVGGGGVKRAIDDVGFGSDERAGKRSRFEVIE